MTRTEAIQQLSQQLQTADFTPQMVNLLKQATERVLTRAKASLNASIEEGTATRITNELQNISNNMTQATTEWIDATTGSLVIFPEGTRFVSKDAEKLVVVTEMEPQVRPINFRQVFPDRTVNHTFAISLPYIQMVSIFTRQGNDYTFGNQLYMSCTKTPLRSLDQQVYKLPLPNVHPHGQICTGSMRNLPGAGTSIVEKINAIMNSYWSSEFNTDLIHNFLGFCQSNRISERFNSTDEIVAAFRRVQELSAANPMFAIAPTTNYQVLGSLNNIIPTDNSSRTSRSAVINRMKERINDSNKNIGNSVMQTIRGFAVVDENVDRPHIETMKDVYKNIITAAYDNLWNEVNATAEAQKRADQEALNRQRQEADRINRDAQRIRQEFEEERRRWLAEKATQESRLSIANNYLQRKLQEVGSNMQEALNPNRAAPVQTQTPVQAPPVRSPIFVNQPAPEPTPVQQPTNNGVIPNPPGYSGRGRPRSEPWRVGSIFRRKRADGSYQAYVYNGREWVESR